MTDYPRFIPDNRQRNPKGCAFAVEVHVLRFFPAQYQADLWLETMRAAFPGEITHAEVVSVIKDPEGAK